MMNDYINREAVRNELYDADAITMKGVAILNSFPGVDAVEVVRCKDCEFWGYTNFDFGDCTHGRFAMPGIVNPSMRANEFCCLGKRKETE